MMLVRHLFVTLDVVYSIVSAILVSAVAINTAARSDSAGRLFISVAVINWLVALWLTEQPITSIATEWSQ